MGKITTIAQLLARCLQLSPHARGAQRALVMHKRHKASRQAWAFASALAVFGPSISASIASENPDLTLRGRLDSVLNAAIEQHRIVGAVVLVAHNGNVVYHRAAGLADREAGKPMTENTIFNYSSLTKPIVTAAAMRLLEQGRMRMEDPVTVWLPEFKPRLPSGREPTMTVRQLLNSTSGLSYRFYEANGSDYDRLNVSDGLDQPGLSRDDFLRRLGGTELRFEPGSDWKYSLSLDVLGLAMERSTGKPLPDLVEDLVIRPLGLHDTAFHITDHTRASAYYVDGKSEPTRMVDGTVVPLSHGLLHFAPTRIDDPASYPSGGAGMAGTASDFLRFLEVMRKGGQPILKARTVADMMRAQATAPIAFDPGFRYGFGWAVLVDVASAQTLQSKGTINWLGVYGHTWFVDPKRGLTLVALTNTTLEGSLGAFPGEIRDAVYGVSR